MNKQPPTKEELENYGCDLDIKQNYTLILEEYSDIEIYHNVPGELIEPYYNYITGIEYVIYRIREKEFKKQHPEIKDIKKYIKNPFTDNIEEFLETIKKYKSEE